MSKSVRFICQHLDEHINIAELARGVGLSRRSLELRFRVLLGRTPLQEITRARIELAKQSLVETNLPMWRIARKCGFNRNTYFSDVFRRATGLPPTVFRQWSRAAKKRR